MPLIEEVANSSSTSAPGWAYVPDTGYDPSKAPIQPAARKRTARVFGLAGRDASARKNTALLKRLADLDKDNLRDVQVPIPTRQKEVGGRVKGKTPATRKILLAQKTFANYLADEEALSALEPHRPSSRGKATAPATPAAQALSTNPATGVPSQQNLVAPPGPAFGGIDDSSLLWEVVPAVPSEALMEALISAPPLSFTAARVQPSSSGRPQRFFCELCGYWGTIKCIQCGARVCGLNCKRVHDEGRCQKYPG